MSWANRKLLLAHARIYYSSKFVCSCKLSHLVRKLITTSKSPLADFSVEKNDKRLEAINLCEARKFTHKVEYDICLWAIH